MYRVVRPWLVIPVVLAAGGCDSQLSTEPSETVTRSRPPTAPVSFPAGVYRVVVNVADGAFMGIERCEPSGLFPTAQTVRTEVEIVPEAGGFHLRPLHAGDTLTVRLRDLGGNYTGSRDLGGDGEGKLLDRAGSGLTASWRGLRAITSGQAASDSKVETVSAWIGLEGSVVYVDATGRTTTCQPERIHFDLERRY